MKKVLVICTGNIYRSPMVAALLSARLAAAGLAEPVQVTSAGIFAVAGAPADPTVAAVLQEHGINVAGRPRTT